jgi:flagellar biosynthesis component FlhA
MRIFVKRVYGCLVFCVNVIGVWAVDVVNADMSAQDE